MAARGALWPTGCSGKVEWWCRIQSRIWFASARSAAASGRGSGAAQVCRRAFRLRESIAVDLAVMLGEAGRLDVPAAVVAAWVLLVATVAVERPAQEKLFQPGAVVVGQF